MYKAWAKLSIILFVLFLSIIVVATEWMLRTQVAPADVQKQHAAYFRNSNARNAAFGDSLTTYGFTGGSEISNFADWGEPYVITTEKILYHFAKISPGRVILQVDPMLFSAARNDDDISIESRRGVVFGKNPAFLIATKNLRGGLNAFWWTYLRKGKIQSLVKLHADGWRTKEDRFEKFSPEERMLHAREFKITLQPGSASLETNQNWKAFKEAVRFLVTKGANVCLVHLPVSPEYWEMAKNEPFYKHALVAIQEVAEKNNIRFINASTWLNSARFFADPYHMSYVGAPPYSARVIRRCFDAPDHPK